MCVYGCLLQQVADWHGLWGRGSSLQQWNLNLAATDSDSSESAALEVDNGNSNADPVSWDWEQLAASAYTDDDRPIILFDGQCNLCNGGVNFALDHDPNGM